MSRGVKLLCPSSAITLINHQPVWDGVLSLLPISPRTISAGRATMRAEGDISFLCVSQADDCRLLCKLPKVKCLRNGRREGKSCLPPPSWETQFSGGGKVMEPWGTSMEWATKVVSGSCNKRGADKRRCDKGLGFEIDPPPLSLEKMGY